AICDRAYVIRSGSLLASGNADEIATNKDVKKYYLGAEFKLLD
ncbi:TPA: LPS export ABC transporter ATP-binding protein, partial [Campylobacter jejuni]